MSSLYDPSSIILFVGAIFIFIFIVHGLWFSDKPQNRKLKKDDHHDQELSKSHQVGKVRIVTADIPDKNNNNTAEDVLDLNVGQINKIAPASSGSAANNTGSTGSHRAVLPSDYADDFSELQNSAIISVNHKKRQLKSMGIEEVNLDERQSSSPFNNQTAPLEAAAYAGGTVNGNNAQSNADPAAGGQDQTGDADNAPLGTDPYNPTPNVYYQLVLAADRDRPYLGEDIEALCNQYGFIQGFIQDTLKIYFVYENAAAKENEVFRICSMESPFYFPEDMHNYKTSAIALYMGLPERGKAFAYFKALRMAAEIFTGQLGGRIEDSRRIPMTPQDLDQFAQDLQNYDKNQSAVS